MRDEDRTKEQLIGELQELRQHISKLEESAIDHNLTVEALRQRENLYRTLVETIPHGIQENDTNGIITFSNPAHCRIYGYKEEELIGKPIWYMHVSEEAQEELRQYLELLVRKQPAPTPYLTQNRTKDGRVIDIQVDWAYKRDKHNKVTGFISVITDITRQKRAEESFRESMEQLTQIANNISGVFWLRDLKEEKVYYVSPAYENIWGRSTEDVYRNPMSWLAAIHPEDRERVRRASVKCRSEGCQGGFREEYRIIRPDDSIRWIRDRAFPVRDLSGKVCRVAGISEDITGSKHIEEARVKLQAELQHSQKMEAIGRLAGGIGHDFNNILTAIKNFSNLGMKKFKESAPPAYDIFEHIRTASYRATNLTRQLLTFSNKEPSRLDSLDMNKLINDLLQMLTRIIGEDICITADLDTKLRRIMGDRGKMEQVIMNMVVNARDAMPQGGTITIKTENITIGKEHCMEMMSARHGRFVRLIIEDTGAGISEEHIEKIFEPFFTTKKNGAGSGLGLSVVYGIIEEHKGWIKAFSEHGKGTTFNVYLPAVDAVMQRETEDTAMVKDLRGSSERILLVEDDAQVRKSTMMTLTDEGYVVLGAENAIEALDIFKKEEGRFHLVISDFILPEKNGIQLIEELRSINRQIKPILLSGYMDRKVDMSKMQDAGIGFLRKPFDIEELLRVIKEVMRTV